MSERLSDKTVAEWQATVTFLGGGAAEGSPIDRLHKDHLRARAEVVENNERIAALEAELARLTPSGQVAEDVKTVETYAFEIGSTMPYQKDVKAALARLAAEAQGYEAASAREFGGMATNARQAEEIQSLRSERDAAVERASELDWSGAVLIAQLCAERDDARHQLGEAGMLLLSRTAERDEARGAMRLAAGERGAAVADNAAWRKVTAGLHSAAPSARPDDGAAAVARWDEAKAAYYALRTLPHPGAELLERMRALEEVVRTLAHGWDGTLAGMAVLRTKAQALIDTSAGGHVEPVKGEAVLTARIAALREHAQMLYESAPPTNSRTARDQSDAWERAKRIHHEVMAAPDAGAELMTELNDHRRNIEALRGELGAKDDEHVVDAFRRYNNRLLAVIQKMGSYIRSRAGHEENCRGWRKPVKDKSAPAWKRRGEWMDLERCSCGPGELLRLAAEAAP